MSINTMDIQIPKLFKTVNSNNPIIYNHPSYEILVKIKSPITGMRKKVRWDFGDGTIVIGEEASHLYTKSGTYTIQATIYDSSGNVNDTIASSQIQVRNIIPTQLNLLAITNNEVPISKNNNIGKLQIDLGPDVISNPQINAFLANPDSEEKSYIEIKEEQNDAEKYPYFYLKKYYTFLEKTNIKNVDGSKIQDILIPTSTYSPTYVQIFAKFIIETNNSVNLKLAILDPENIINLDDLKLPTVFDINVEQKVLKYPSVKALLDDDYAHIGRTGILDIWFKNDFIKDNKLLFEIKRDTLQLEGENLLNESYLNISPIIIPVKTNTNNIETVSGLTLNGILTLEDNMTENKILFLDKYLEHNFYKNYKITAYLAKYIKNDTLSETDISYSLYKGEENIPFLLGENIEIVEKLDNDYFKTYDLTPLNDDIKLYINNVLAYDNSKLIELESLILPKEKMPAIDIERLLSTYMQHPMYEDATNLKTLLFDIFNNNKMLPYTLSKGVNILADNVDYSTCYLDKFLSILEMLNEPITKYDISGFSKVNELRDITRILSMNYSKLFGNFVKDEYDIRMNPAFSGKNVGNKVEPNESIYCDEDYNIIGVRKGKKIYTFEHNKTPHLIVKNDFNYDTFLVSFNKIEPLEYELFDPDSIDENDWIIKNKDFIDKVKYTYKINDYQDNWGWCLNLPPESKNVTNKDSIISCYYSFYLLNPNVEFNRKYNFIHESTIPYKNDNDGKKVQLSPEEWEKDFGFTYDCLMKILTYHLGLRNNIN